MERAAWITRGVFMAVVGYVSYLVAAGRSGLWFAIVVIPVALGGMLLVSIVRTVTLTGRVVRRGGLARGRTSPDSA